LKFVEAGGVRASAIGLGCWQFGSREWGYGGEYANREAGKIVGRALELGINLLDTAEIYGPWRSERIVGEAIRGRREQVFIATKLFPVGLSLMVRGRARGSARRLGIDHIDLYQQHWPSALFSARSTMPRFRQLVESGLVRHVGVSNHSLAQWQACDEALGGPVLSNQVRYSLAHREPERDLLPWAQRNGRILIAYSPLGQGLLSGKYRDSAPRNFRRFSGDFGADARRRREPLIAKLLEIGKHHDATPSQVALAWLVAKPNVVAIPGASNVRQVEENARAADLALTAPELEELDSLSA
jgi:aryl-alcohol dehydrogenase-like predicted oxidoreductase